MIFNEKEKLRIFEKFQERHLSAEKTVMIKCKCRHSIWRERQGRLAKEIFTHASMAARGTKADPVYGRKGQWFVCSKQILCNLITRAKKIEVTYESIRAHFFKAFRNHWFTLRMIFLFSFLPLPPSFLPFLPLPFFLSPPLSVCVFLKQGVM